MYVAQEPFGVADNPAFVARGKVPPVAPEQELFSRLMRAVELVNRQELPLEPEVIVRQDRRLDRIQVADLMKTEKFRVACADRGIAVSEHPGLSAEQLAALAIYTDMSNPLPHAKKLRAAGVTEAKWKGWLAQRPFAEELAHLSSANLRTSVLVGQQRLAEHVDAGNMQAIEFVFAMEGRFRKDAPAVDMRKILLDLYTILDEEGVPIETLTKVHGRIKTLLGEPVVMEATVIEPQSLEQGVAS